MTVGSAAQSEARVRIHSAAAQLTGYTFDLKGGEITNTERSENARSCGLSSRAVNVTRLPGAYRAGSGASNTQGAGPDLSIRTSGEPGGTRTRDPMIKSRIPAILPSPCPADIFPLSTG